MALASRDETREEDALAANAHSPLQAVLPELWYGCDGCDDVLGNLLRGIEKAGFLDSHTWDADGRIFTASLKGDDPIYGNIAPRSRLPWMFVVGPQLKLTVKIGPSSSAVDGSELRTTVVDVEGLRITPSEQGHDLFMNIVTKLPECKPKDKKCLKKELIEREEEAAGAYFKKVWKDNSNPLGDNRKIGMIMQTMTNSWKIRSPISTFGKWPSIFFGMLCSTPVSLTQFKFQGDTVAIARTPDSSHKFAKDFAPTTIEARSRARGEKTLVKLGGTLLKLFEGQASSTFNWLLAGMSSEVSTAIGRKGADPKKIGNLMTLCEDVKEGEPQCSGSTPGRVAWSAQPPPSMQ